MSIAQICTQTGESQLSAGHHGIWSIPKVITYSAPCSTLADFHTPFILCVPIGQPDTITHTACKQSTEIMQNCCNYSISKLPYI